MVKVFVAYSRRNGREVRRFVDELESTNPKIEVWYGERNLVPARDIVSEIRRALSAANALVFCASGATSSGREGDLLAEERRYALHRLGSDPNFKVVSVIIDRHGKVPRGFPEHPTIDLSGRENWRSNVSFVASIILAD